MQITSARNPIFKSADSQAIDLLVVFDGSSVEVPFTASNSDLEAHGRDLFARAMAGEFGAVSQFVPPPPPIPEVVTMRQARLALLQSGLLAQVNTAIANMSGIDGDAARIEWEFSNTVERNQPLVQSLIGALGLTEAQLDDLFTLAATL